MLTVTSLPTLYNLVDTESNLAGAIYTSSDGTPIGMGNNCAPVAYSPSPALGELRDYEKKALVFGGIALYFAWVLFFGKRTQGRDRHRDAAF